MTLTHGTGSSHRDKTLLQGLCTKNAAGLTKYTTKSLFWKRLTRVEKFARETSEQAFLFILFIIRPHREALTSSVE